MNSFKGYRRISMRKFAALAAHDLKNPLQMISQFMDRLVQKYEDQLDEITQ